MPNSSSLPASCLLLRRSNDLICTGLWSFTDSPENLETMALVRNSKARVLLLAGRFFSFLVEKTSMKVGILRSLGERLS